MRSFLWTMSPSLLHRYVITTSPGESSCIDRQTQQYNRTARFTATYRYKNIERYLGPRNLTTPKGFERTRIFAALTVHYLVRVIYLTCRIWCDVVQGRHERRQKVVVLRELYGAIIYTAEISKQVTRSHVRVQLICR